MKNIDQKKLPGAAEERQDKELEGEETPHKRQDSKIDRERKKEREKRC